MCSLFDCFKKPHIKRKARNLYCSCDVCGREFNHTGYLLTHMGYHDTEELNRLLDVGYGTVRCKQCWVSFKTVVDLENHSCDRVIRGLSPIHSSDSLQSVLIHEN